MVRKQLTPKCALWQKCGQRLGQGLLAKLPGYFDGERVCVFNPCRPMGSQIQDVDCLVTVDPSIKQVPAQGCDATPRVPPSLAAWASIRDKFLPSIRAILCIVTDITVAAPPQVAVLGTAVMISFSIATLRTLAITAPTERQPQPPIQIPQVAELGNTVMISFSFVTLRTLAITAPTERPIPPPPIIRTFRGVVCTRFDLDLTTSTLIRGHAIRKFPCSCSRFGSTTSKRSACSALASAPRQNTHRRYWPGTGKFTHIEQNLSTLQNTGQGWEASRGARVRGD